MSPIANVRLVEELAQRKADREPAYPHHTVQNLAIDITEREAIRALCRAMTYLVGPLEAPVVREVVGEYAFDDGEVFLRESTGRLCSMSVGAVGRSVAYLARDLLSGDLSTVDAWETVRVIDEDLAEEMDRR